MKEKVDWRREKFSLETSFFVAHTLLTLLECVVEKDEAEEESSNLCCSIPVDVEKCLQYVLAISGKR